MSLCFHSQRLFTSMCCLGLRPRLMGFEREWTSANSGKGQSRAQAEDSGPRLRGISLFSGVGGLDLGLQKWIRRPVSDVQLLHHDPQKLPAQ